MDRRRVLLIDAAEIMLRLEKTFLTRRAFEISVARTGESGLAKARTLRPHLVVVDLRLPDMDGDAICRQIKADPERGDAAVIIVSTARDQASRDRCMLAGCEGFMTKPLDKDSFCRLAENLLGVTMRIHPRVTAKVPCEVRAMGLRIPSMIHDISQDGAFVSPSGMLPDLKELELHFCLPGGTEPVTVRTRVCWSDVEGVRGRRGVGVQFLEVAPEASVRLKTFIAVRTKEDVPALAHTATVSAAGAASVHGMAWRAEGSETGERS